MHDSSFKGRRLVVEDSLKLNNTNKHLFNKAKRYFILFLYIKYL